MTKTQVLIVEDDTRFCASLARAVKYVSKLTLLGCAHTVAEARSMLAQQVVDVLLLDLGLPDESGLRLIHEILAMYPECDVLVVSIFEDDHHIVEAISAGATGYLLKDTNPVEIAQQIQTLREGGSPISPKIARRVLKLFTPIKGLNVTNKTPLSERELEMLTLASKGLNFEEIAHAMGITRHTVLCHVKRCYRKLHVHSKGEAIYEARQQGLIGD